MISLNIDEACAKYLIEDCGFKVVEVANAGYQVHYKIAHAVGEAIKEYNKKFAKTQPVLDFDFTDAYVIESAKTQRLK